MSYKSERDEVVGSSYEERWKPVGKEGSGYEEGSIYPDKKVVYSGRTRRSKLSDMSDEADNQNGYVIREDGKAKQKKSSVASKKVPRDLKETPEAEEQYNSESESNDESTVNQRKLSGKQESSSREATQDNARPGLSRQDGRDAFDKQSPKSKGTPKKWYDDEDDKDDDEEEEYESIQKSKIKKDMKLPEPKTEKIQKKSSLRGLVAKAKLLSPFISKKNSSPSTSKKPKHFDEEDLDSPQANHKGSLFNHNSPDSDSRPKEERKEIGRSSFTDLEEEENNNWKKHQLLSKEIFSMDSHHGSGAIVGQPGSGVLLEGWLRQKQRKGVKGMKIWNDRYFVLYAKYNEIRYYSDVTQAAWGPIPIGEIGAIPLRLIQKIITPSHPKYKGCRFDITCRSSWGTHYADDYVDDDADAHENKSTRVYSLLGDCPQTRVSWVTMLDSLLKRSDSPRIDRTIKASATAKEESLSSDSTMKRRKSSIMDPKVNIELLQTDPKEIPRSVTLAVDYLESSTPGIEMKKFYEVEPSLSKLKSALTYMNQFEADLKKKSPENIELEQYLDPVLAGAIIKYYLKNIRQTIHESKKSADSSCIFTKTLCDNILKVAREIGDHNEYESTKMLKNLLTIPTDAQYKKLEYLIFHFAGVVEYANVNGMKAKDLGAIFGPLILTTEDASQTEIEQAEEVMAFMIANAEEIL